MSYRPLGVRTFNETAIALETTEYLKCAWQRGNVTKDDAYCTMATHVLEMKITAHPVFAALLGQVGEAY